MELMCTMIVFCIGLIIFFNTKRGKKWLDSLD